MNFASFGLVMVLFGLGAFAIVAAPAIEPDHDGLIACQKLHPIRYCRIANGFPVKPLDTMAP